MGYRPRARPTLETLMATTTVAHMKVAGNRAIFPTRSKRSRWRTRRMSRGLKPHFLKDSRVWIRDRWELAAAQLIPAYLEVGTSRTYLTEVTPSVQLREHHCNLFGAQIRVEDKLLIQMVSGNAFDGALAISFGMWHLFVQPLFPHAPSGTTFNVPLVFEAHEEERTFTLPRKIKDLISAHLEQAGMDLFQVVLATEELVHAMETLIVDLNEANVSRLALTTKMK